MSLLREQVSKITLVAFDFDGVFTDNHVYVDEDGKESVKCWRGDGIGIRKLEKLGIRCVVISGESNPVVSHRCAKLRIQHFCGVEDKLARLKELEPDLSKVAFVGNDLNDLDCLKAVGFPIVVDSFTASGLDDDLVLCGERGFMTERSGGHGAVREVCDMIAWNR